MVSNCLIKFEITVKITNFDKKKHNMNPAYTKCPSCGAEYSYVEQSSENIADSEFWSDGFCLTPMRRDIVDFSKCQACNAYFWIPENSVEEPSDLSSVKNLENTLDVDNISDEDIDFIKAAFRGGLAGTPEKEAHLRIKLWQVINHIMRNYNSQGIFSKIKQKFFETAEFKEAQNQYNAFSSLKQNNLIRLINLLKLDKDNTDYILFAEIYRELGDFGKATVYCYKAENAPRGDKERALLLKQYVIGKNKITYKL